MEHFMFDVVGLYDGALIIVTTTKKTTDFCKICYFIYCLFNDAFGNSHMIISE
jgi:hypothetical protein